MEYGFFQQHFQSRGLDTLVSGESDRRELDRIIWEELSHGVVKPESRAVAQSMINDLANDRAEAIVLACTELCLLINPEDSPRPVYDTTRLHAEAILNYALADVRN
jgi:aspartate racemase